MSGELDEFVGPVEMGETIQSFWALIEKGYLGVFHWMSPKHLHPYLAEELRSLQHSRRGTAMERIKAAFDRMRCKRLTYAGLVS